MKSILLNAALFASAFILSIPQISVADDLLLLDVLASAAATPGDLCPNTTHTFRYCKEGVSAAKACKAIQDAVDSASNPDTALGDDAPPKCFKQGTKCVSNGITVTNTSTRGLEDTNCCSVTVTRLCSEKKASDETPKDPEQKRLPY